jgi:hypothetical protein
MLIFLLTYSIYGQNNSTKIEFIKNSTEYYWGEGNAESIDRAEDLAFNRLTKMIAVKVSSSFENIVSETNSDIQETVNSIIKTYSTNTFKNVEKIQYPTENGYYLFLYIEKLEIQKILNTRKKLIYSLYQNGQKAEFDNNFAYALKSYYFAIVLMNSIPEQIVEYNDVNFTTLLPRKISDILNNTKFNLSSNRLLSDSEREIRLKVSTNDQLSKSLEFSFWDGNNQQNVLSRDGEAIIKLYGASVNFDKLSVRIKYNFYESKSEIKEVSELWDLVNLPVFENNKSIILTDANVSNNLPTKMNLSNNSNLNKSPSSSFNIMLNDKNNSPQIKKIGSEAIILFQLLEDKNINGIKDKYKNDPYIINKLESILKYNNIKLVDKNIIADLNEFHNGWEVREVKVFANYSSIRKQTTESLIIDFDKNGNLYDVNFGVIESLYEDFLAVGKKSGDWGNRQVIIKFMEKYRTTFMTRNLTLLDSLFADEAVIIVGREVKINKLKDVSSLNNQIPNIEYIRMNKEQYILRQKEIFESRQDLYLGYSTFNISRKNKQPNVYGISLRQNYLASGYADEGYLFLLVDFNEELPQIYVRSWQPQEWDESELIKLSSFNLNK